MEVSQRRVGGGGSFSRWSSTRRGTLAIAAVSTLVAAGILAFAMDRYRQSVNSTEKPVTVLVATKLITKGTAGAAIGVGEYFRFVSVPSKKALAGALANTAALHGEVASTDIYPGQQLTASDFIGGGLYESRLPPNQRAITVPLDTSHGMIGAIQTGDRVDVYVSFKHGPGEKSAPFLRLLTQNVVVLDAGHASSSGGLGAGGNQTKQTSNIALEVPSRKAAELAFAADNGKIWLVLRPSHGTVPSSQIVDEASIVSDTSQVSSGGRK